MAQSAFSFPKQWEDWTSWALGLWLLLSPWALFFDHESRALENAVVLGAWLAISPWALSIVNSAARWNFLIVGTLVVALALYEIREMQAAAAQDGTAPE